MIVTRLIGGLGNQMFQYAAAKALALKHQTTIKVDTTTLEADPKGKYTQRYYELSIFNSNIEIATNDDFETINRYKNFPVFIKNILNAYYFANEQGSHYQLDFEKYPSNCYLNGFWQSELYFKKFEAEIKNDFTFNELIINENKDLAEKISNSQSVSLHIRRGDYVSNKEANQFHGLCDLNYYKRAVSLLKEKDSTIELFVFSDDIAWCKQHLIFDKTIHYIETQNPHSDLYLMTLCKHNVIANSSFSWWGAWLNNNPQKNVVAPKNWFANTDVNTSNIIPKSWHQI